MRLFCLSVIASLLIAWSAAFALDPVKIIVLAKTTLQPEGLEQQAAILAKLPKDVMLYYFYAAAEGPNPNWLKDFRKRFATPIQAGRFRFVSTFEMNLWTRDFTPEFVKLKNGKSSFVLFNYGELRHDPKSRDQANPMGRYIADVIAKDLGITITHCDLNIEGGNLIIDDQNRMYTTVSTLERNPELSQAQIVKRLKDALKVKEVHFIPRIQDEETGHIDISVFYPGGNTMVVAKSLISQRNIDLDMMANYFKKLKFTVKRVMMADHEFQNGLDRSYTNSFLVGNLVFVPKYGVQKQDGAAKKFFASLGLDVVMVDCKSLTALSGELHCITKGYAICDEIFLKKFGDILRAAK